MKTDDLIAMLSTNVKAVDQRRPLRILIGAVAIGAMVAFGAALMILGGRTDMQSGEAIASVIAKVVFATVVAGLAFFYLNRLVRPGEQRRGWMVVVALPFVGIVGLASIGLAHASASHCQTTLVEAEWLECLLTIPVIAIVPFVLVVCAMRQAAPTHLRGAGALVGLVAGGLGAAGDALHCTADSLPFVATWYSGAILLCALAGAALGPRLLRW